MEYHPLGLWIERRAAIDLPREMKLHARLLVPGVLQEPHAFEVQRRATWKFEEHGVVQILLGIAQNTQGLASFHHEDVIRQVIGEKRPGSLGGIAQLADALLREAHRF